MSKNMIILLGLASLVLAIAAVFVVILQNDASPQSPILPTATLEVYPPESMGCVTIEGFTVCTGPYPFDAVMEALDQDAANGYFIPIPTKTPQF